jgi:7-cyano-7-deazaguanine synthase
VCSIGGVLIFGELDEGRARAIEEKLRSIAIRGSERGRDSFGVVVLKRTGEFLTYKSRESAERALSKAPRLIEPGAVAAIFNNRAEPTTEHIMDKREDDIQPMLGEYIAVSHNGTIANDVELEKKYGLRRKSKIDTAILPPLLEAKWDGTLEGLRSILRDEVVGSYALAVLDRRRPGRVWLAANFKPLYAMWDRELNALFFASFDDYMQDGSSPPWALNPVKRVEPYTAVEAGVDGTWRTASLWRADAEAGDGKKRGRALVVASGGLDSTVAATLLVRQGYDVTLLHFNYRHVAEDPERRAVREIAKFLGVPLIEIDMDFFRVVRRSPLLGDGEINRVDRGREGAEFAHEWVPARNLVFIALAVALAEAWGYDYVATGINLEEAGAYPDNEMEFIRLLNAVMPYATGPQRRVRLLMPVGHLVKHEIVRLGLEIGAPLHLTWSCYDKGPKHCGRCGPCYMRRVAFKINGVRDPVEYDLPPGEEEEFWRGSKPYVVPLPPAARGLAARLHKSLQ